MGDQAVERREVMQLLAAAAVASQFPGFRRWAFGCAQSHGGTVAAPKQGSYQPQFFSPEEYALIERLADLIIPGDGVPGAREAGVAEFIDLSPRLSAPMKLPA